MRKASLDVIAFVYSESGCSWGEDEYTASLSTIGCFDIEYIDDFTEAVQQWVSDNLEELENDRTYQLIMKHVYEHDGAGATTGRHFDVIDTSFKDW